MKHKLWIILAVAALLGALCCEVTLADDSGSCGDNVSYSFNSSTGTLTISGTGAIEDYQEEYPGWYAHRDSITSVRIGDGVTYIGKYAFYDMNALAEVTIGNGVTSIGKSAFRGCPNLTDVTVPGSVISIGDNCFYSCSNLTKATIMNPGCAFGSSVFTNCPAALDLYGWPDSTTETYAGASRGFVALGSLSGSCGENVSYSFNPVNQILTISGTGPMADYPGTTFPDWYEYRDMISGAIVQNGVTTVGSYAFYKLSNLTMAVVGTEVTSIGAGAYVWCERLTGITLPASVTSIGNLAFYSCTDLTSVTIRHPECEIGKNGVSNVFEEASADLVLHGWPDSTTEAYAQVAGHGFQSLGTLSGPCGDNVTWNFNPGDGQLTISGVGAMADYAKDNPGWYDYNYYITSIFVKEGVTYIGSFAFSQMTSVTIVVLPDSLTSIGNRAFNQCSALNGAVLPQNVTSVGSYAFSLCYNLVKVIIKNPDCTIGNGAFMMRPNSFILAGWPGSTTEAYAQADNIEFQSLGSVLNLPANLTTIESEAFAGVYANAVHIPSSVTSIVGNPFAGSKIHYVFGMPGSAAEAFAYAYPHLYIFVPVED